jgi:hypothetical protein
MSLELHVAVKENEFYRFIEKSGGGVFYKLGRYKIFHNDTDTIRYKISYLKVGIFDIDTKRYKLFVSERWLIRNG